MPTAINNFLLSFAAAVAGAVTPALAMYDPTDVDSKGAVWVHNAVEGKTADAYTVWRIYGGVDEGAFADARQLSVSLQADTRGVDAEAVLAQSWAQYEAMKNADGSPWMLRTIDGKRFNASTGAVEDDPAGDWQIRVVKFFGAPGVRGVDGSRRLTATGNYEVEFGFVPAP